MSFLLARHEYHQRICREIIRIQPGNPEYPNFADKTNKASREIAWHILNQISAQHQTETITGQTAGGRFENITRDYLQHTFEQLQHLRPGIWHYAVNLSIDNFDQYAHLADLQTLTAEHRELAGILGREHIIIPDIVIARLPLTDSYINQTENLISAATPVANHTPLRAANQARPILHASISCKWTIRSDRAQNARAEALNLIRHRKGALPHIAAVTAEPLPTRIASLALGTGDLDCVYHFALPELENALRDLANEDQMDMLQTLIQGRRLRDISDLPLDLAA